MLKLFAKDAAAACALAMFVSMVVLVAGVSV